MSCTFPTISYFKNHLIRKHSFWLLFLTVLMAQCGIAQRSTPAGLCTNTAFDREVAKWIRQSVPVIGAQDLYQALQSKKEKIYLLDARAPEEYEVSHLPGAIWVGYDKFQENHVAGIPKGSEVIVYCSIGYRSERIGEKLRKMGYTRTRNLYGSIFDWANRGLPLVDGDNQPTRQVHTYNKKWSRWVDEKLSKKTW